MALSDYLNAVVDLSHHNGNVDLVAARHAGILGVIHKGTQGIGFTDPQYGVNRTKAGDAGVWWGTYHFGDAGDGVAQADAFLNAVRPNPNDLLVLDFEANAQGPSMSLEEARAFVTHVFAAVGRWPGLYAGHYLKELLGSQSDSVLRNCWFWLSQYGPTAVVPANWPTWTLWQYTDGAQGSGPYAVPGIGRCDRDIFNGTAAGLATLWNATAPATASVTT